MQTKLTIKTIIPYIILGVIIVTASFFMKGCHDKPYVNIKPDNTIQYAKEDTVNKNMIKLALEKLQLEHKYDSLKIVLGKRIYRKTRVKDSLIFISDSSCIINLIALYNESERTDSTYNIAISNLVKQKGIDSLNTIELIKKVNIKQDRISKDSIILTDSIPLKITQSYKRGLKKGRKQGIIIGTAIETAVIVGGLLLVK